MRFSTLLTLLGLFLQPVLAADCFCLVDADDNLWFDCREQQRPMRTQPLVFCTDAATGKQIELTGRTGVSRVADGDAPCTPCRLSDAQPPDHTIRGDDEQSETAGEPEGSAPSSADESTATGEERP